MERVIRTELGIRRRGSKLSLKHGVDNLPAATSSPKDVSDKPWSAYSESDYTVKQWDAACLIHNHGSGLTSKIQCKLPVKTPDGTLNKDGVFAAAAALAGARTPLIASSAQKASAATQLLAYYKQLDATPPPSLTQMAHSVDVGDFLKHHGIKGQKWGIRNPRNRSSSAKEAMRTKYSKPASKLSDAEITKRIKRMELEKRYSDLNKSEVASGKKYASDLLKNSGKAVVGIAVGTVTSHLVGKALKTAFG
jgi:hypothetical protein